MKNGKVFAARLISVIVVLLGGAAAQIGLWKTKEGSAFDALVQHPYLWIFYLLIGLFIGEHCLRLMKRKTE